MIRFRRNILQKFFRRLSPCHKSCFIAAIWGITLLTYPIAPAAARSESALNLLLHAAASAESHRIPISYATTRITGPLTKNGLVDYVAAFNKRFGKGVTPQNNAAVPLLILFRPQSFQGGSYKMVAGKMVYIPDKNYGRDLRRALGISKRDLIGPRFVRYHKFYRGIGTATAEGTSHDISRLTLAPAYVPGKCYRQAWSEKTYPLIAAWLRSDAASLGVAAAAFRQRHFFVPLLGSASGGHGMAFGLGSVLPALASAKAVGDGLAARSMLALGQGRIRACERNLLAVHRLASLLTQEHLLIATLVADSLEIMGCQGDEALARSRWLSAKASRAYLARLSKLSRRAMAWTALDTGERWMALDGLQRAAASRDAVAFIGLGSPVPKQAISWKSAQYAAAMAMLNRLQDHIVKIFKLKNFRQRAISFLSAYRHWRHSRKPVDSSFLQFVGTMGRTIAPEARCAAFRRMDYLSFALAAYLGGHGAFPTRLAQLEPKYLPTIPRDPFTGKPFRYTASPTGCTISSPGAFPPQLFPGSQPPQGQPIIVHLSLPPRRASK